MITSSHPQVGSIYCLSASVWIRIIKFTENKAIGYDLATEKYVGLLYYRIYQRNQSSNYINAIGIYWFDFDLLKAAQWLEE